MTMEQFTYKFFETLVEDLNNIKEIRNKVITLHLYVEFLVDNFLNAFFVKPQEIIKEFSFRNKLRIIEAMGLNRELCKYIKKINNFRNKFAHELNVSLIKLDFKDIFVKEPETFSKLKDIDKIQALAITILLEMNQQFHEFLKWRKEVFQKSI